MVTPVKKQRKKKTSTELYYAAVGRRKESTCRVRLYLSPKGEIKSGNVVIKKGEIVINKLPIEKYFTSETFKKIYMEPLVLTDSENRFAIMARAVGGGKKGQLIAFQLAVSRALEKIDKDYRSVLKPHGLLSVDARVKERKKAGLVKARKQRQSPKR
jgi:small subunit ribosomal protein S9